MKQLWVKVLIDGLGFLCSRHGLATVVDSMRESFVVTACASKVYRASGGKPVLICILAC